jgi:hypothetical protein
LRRLCSTLQHHGHSRRSEVLASQSRHAGVACFKPLSLSRAARAIIWALRVCSQHIGLAWGDSAYTGTLLDLATALGITVQIVANSPAKSACTSYPAAGSSNAPWPGSPAAAATYATTNAATPATPRSSNGE